MEKMKILTVSNNFPVCGASTCSTKVICSPTPLLDFQCTDGVVVLLDVIQTRSAESICIKGAFNPADDPVPLTMRSAQLGGSQQAIYDLKERKGNLERTASFTVNLPIKITYENGMGAQRSMVIDYPVSVKRRLPVPCTAPELEYRAELLAGPAVTEAKITGTDITFKLSYSLRILAYSKQKRFSIAPFTQGRRACAASCVDFLRIKKQCILEGVSSTAPGIIHYPMAGIPAESILGVIPKDQKPSVLSISTGAQGAIILDLSFPAQLVILDSCRRPVTQDTLVYATVNLTSTCFAYTAGDVFIADLRAVYKSPTVQGNAINVPLSSITGRLLVMENGSQRVWLKPDTECGPSTTTCVCKMGSAPAATPPK